MKSSIDSYRDGVNSVSRRNFIKGLAAAGATVTLYGCKKNKDAVSPVTLQGDPNKKNIFLGSSGHNCGGRCITRAVVSKGRIERFLTDETTHTLDGIYIDPESRNFPQTRACARCRAYKYRLYHPGRLEYPLKQTKQRGDLSGFIRISWEQALEEIATKHKTVLDEYGVDGIYQIYACGSVSSNFQGAQAGPIGKTNGYAIKMMGGVQTPMFGSYSTHQNTYFGTGYTGADTDINPNTLATHTNTLILWGDNSLSTGNPSAYASVRAVEDMRKRNPQAQVVFIGPEFVDTGVTLADEWVASHPYTDPALVAAMVYHMLENTFDLETGHLRENPWLDINYLDTMVYGFFDSPPYALNEETGEIDAVNPASGNRLIDGVPPGRSYASWVLGNNRNAPTYSELGAEANYTAAQFAKGHDMKRWAPCSYGTANGLQSAYLTKQDYRVPKTPHWASAITGVPEETIRELAALFIQNAPVASRWSGGQQKQADGIANLYSVQALHIITKNVGLRGAGFYWLPFTGATVKNEVGLPVTYTVNAPVKEKPAPSCTAWHTAIKMAYADELMKNGYRARYIPNWQQANSGQLKTGDGNIYWDDGGTKAMICWDRDENGHINTFQDDKGRTYYKWLGMAENKPPKIAGARLMYNPGGNIFINQHENANDSREMLEKLALNTPDDPHSFCLVSMDNFLSPTPRWSDYVLPAATFWEQDDIVAPINLVPFFTQQVSAPPGESKSLWDIGIELLEAYEKVTGEEGIVDRYFASPDGPRTVRGIIRKRFEEAPEDSPYRKMSWEEYLQNPYLPPKPDDTTIPVPARETVMDSYRNAPNIREIPVIRKQEGFHVPTNEYNQGGYGNEYATTEDAPSSPLRFQVYSPVLTWQYKNKFSKWHGYLPEEKRGQQHRDREGDGFVMEIPIYYAYQDYFMEAYGGPDRIKDLNFLLTTTHNRYRSHSSMAENPLLRELTHRVPGKDEEDNFIPANDYGNYAMPSAAFGINRGGSIPELNRTINPDGTVTGENKDIASYSEIWMNETDGKQLLGLQDGDLVQVENPIGAVRCVARLSKRCVRGFVSLHQGCWYDPRPLKNSYNHEYVDVGGNCNTLMASQPSRIDHGNGQQSAMVKIFKVTDY